MPSRFAKLSAPALRKLQPGQRVTERGITAERLPSGDLRWTVGVMVDRQRIHRVLGLEREGVTRGACERYIEAKRTEAREGRLNLPKGRKTALGFSAAAGDYLAKLEETGGKNLGRKRRHLGVYLTPHFGTMPLDAVTGDAIEIYTKKRRDAGAAPGTINRELATLSHLLRRAVDWRWIATNPTKVAKLDEGEGRREVLSEAEAGALMKAAIADSDSYLYLFVAFGLNAAMRHSEILAARFEHLDADRRRLFIPTAKAGAREQPLTAEMVDMLVREREMAADRDGWIFPAQRQKLAKVGHRTRMDRPFRRAVEAAGLDPARITPHVMRHSAITRLIKAGVDLPTIQKISGHRTLAMVLKYTHVDGPHIDRAIASLGTAAVPAANKPQAQITQELHKARTRAV